MDNIYNRLSSDQIEAIKTYGYVYVSNFLEPDECSKIKDEIPKSNKEHYNEENLRTNAVYPSMKSDSRESYASMMLESGAISLLPHVTIDSPVLISLLKFHDQALSALTGTDIPIGNRKMVNWQLYSQNFVGKSNFLRRHRDGNYCSYYITDEKAFRVTEGLYSRYVFGFNIENENDCEFRGTSLYDTISGIKVHLPHEQGSLIIFDNIRMEHFVEQLSKPRVFVGIRSFDFCPVHFISEPKDGYLPLPSLDSPGFIKTISMEEATARLNRFYAEEWPEEYLKIRRQGAVF